MKAVINNDDYKIMQNTLSFEDDIDQRSTCDFNIRDLNNQFSFQRGQRVNLMNNDRVVFSGYIEEVDKIPINNVGNYIHRINCSDMHYLADKRLIILAEENEYAGDIAKTIINDKLSEEGVVGGYTWESNQYESFTWQELNDFEGVI